MTLNFNKDGKFRIIQFADTHFKFSQRELTEEFKAAHPDYQNLPELSEPDQTIQMIEDALENLDYDLIAHTGDFIYSPACADSRSDFIQAVRVFDKAKAPMALTLGNHDTDDGKNTRQDLRRLFDNEIRLGVKKENFFVIDDFECYNLEIKGSEDGKVKHVLYFIDSGDYAPIDGAGTYDWVKPEQVEWFSRVSKTYRQGDQAKRNLVFQHMPVPEYKEASHNILAGVYNESDGDICSPDFNTGLFTNMLIDGETWGMFVGHDHDNTFDSEYMGIHLVYGNPSGYQTYGDEERGVRLIEIDEVTGHISTRLVPYSEFSNK